MKKSILALAVGLGVLSANADTWNMATPYPDNEFHTLNIKEFIKDVETATDGKIKITLHSGASLYKAPEIFKAVRSNQVQMGELLISALSNDDSIFKVDTLPFLATTYPQSQKLWSVSKDIVAKKLDEKGAVLLYVIAWPGQNFYTKAPFENLDYFKGKKMRAYNVLTTQIAKALDASPVTVEASDVAQAFSTGQIEAMITSPITGVSTQAWDYVKNYTEVNAWLPKNMIFVSKRVWNKLDKDTQEKVLAAAEKAEKRGWEESEAANKENLAVLAEHKMNIAQPTPEVKAGLEKIGEKLAEEWVKETGEEGQKILDAYRAAQ